MLQRSFLILFLSLCFAQGQTTQNWKDFMSGLITNSPFGGRFPSPADNCVANLNTNFTSFYTGIVNLQPGDDPDESDLIQLGISVLNACNTCNRNANPKPNLRCNSWTVACVKNAIDANPDYAWNAAEGGDWQGVGSAMSYYFPAKCPTSNKRDIAQCTPPLPVCDPTHFGQSDGCDCNCQDANCNMDPDCVGAAGTMYGCDASAVSCNDGQCVEGTAPPADWDCLAAFYGSADGCDCGCGAPDPDCDIVPALPIYGCDVSTAQCIDGTCSVTKASQRNIPIIVLAVFLGVAVIALIVITVLYVKLRMTSSSSSEIPSTK